MDQPTIADTRRGTVRSPGAGPARPRPAGTVVLLRDGPEGLETLLLRRNPSLAFAGGFWVFPGGAVDDADLEASGGDPDRAGRIAAAREALEETGLSVDVAAMVPLSHWTTPAAERKRFATHFFAAPASGSPRVDGGEIIEARWCRVVGACRAQEQGQLPVLPPTYITLLALAPYADVQAVLGRYRQPPWPRVTPVVARDGEAIVTLYPGDAGYASADPGARGARHRARRDGGNWRFQCEGLDACGVVPLAPATGSDP